MIKHAIHTKLLLLLVCVAALHVTFFAQGFVTKIYTTSDGLPDAIINSISQDSKGYLWVSTRTGLYNFNGNQFVDYGKSMGDKSFTGSLLLEDSRHRLWIQTNDGIALLKNRKLLHFPTSDHLKLNWLFSLTELTDGRIWMLSDKGIYELKDTIWQKQNLVQEYKDLPCRYAVEGPNGIYINYGWQLFLYDKNGIIKPITEKKPRSPYYIWLKKYQGQVYVNTVEGIYKIVEDTLQRIFEKQIKNIYTYDFLVDSRKRMWISSEKYGLLVSEPGEERELTKKVSLPFNQTLLFTEDKEGNIWASNYEGLLKIKDAYVEVFNKQQNSLLEDIRHLALKPDGSLLIKSASQGFIHNMGNGFATDKNFGAADRILNKTVVDVSVYDAKGNLWMVTRDGDLFRVNPRENIHFNKTFTDETFQYVAYDSVTKTVFVCGKKLYAVRNDSLKEIAENRGITSPKRIYCSGGNLIVCTWDSGVYLVNAQGTVQRLPQWQVVAHPYNDFQLFNDPDGGFWTTSYTEGIQKWKWDKNNQPARQFSLSAADGLPNPFVIAACFDKQHRMWVATLSGLVVIERNEVGRYTINQIEQEEPFHINNWMEAQLVTDKKGIVWLSSFHEIMRFHTDKLYFDKAVPTVSINEVLLNLRKTDWSAKTDSLDGLHQVPLFVRLRHNENTISISFDAITNSHNEQVLFSYKLEGLDTGWQAPSGIRSVSFANVAPGAYTFFVRARKPNTNWSSPAQFTFIIRQPFWSTWWFKSLLVLTAAIVIALLFRLRIQRIKNKAILQQQIQELDLKALKAANALMTARQKMTNAEMHALRSQMNPHFIYNSLNSIQSLVLDNRSQEAIRYIGKFARLLRQVLEQSDNNLITLEKELSTLELYIQLEALRLNAPLQYKIEIDEQLMPEKELLPPLIIQPYVENALWHGLSRKMDERNIWIDVSANEEWLFIKIRDNGIGRQQAAMNKKENGLNVVSKGMSITANRLALMNEEKTEKAVSVLDLYDDNHQPCGTEVTLRIVRTTKP